MCMPKRRGLLATKCVASASLGGQARQAMQCEAQGGHARGPPETGQTPH